MMKDIILINGLQINTFSFNLLMFLVLFYMMLVIFDYILGVLSARIKHILVSKVNIQGTLLKLCIVGFILLISVLVIGITNIFQVSDNIFLLLTLIPSIFMGMFSLGEFTSNIEKLAVLFANKKSGLIFNVLNYLSEKIFNVTLETLKSKVEERIDAKAENLTK